MTVNSDKTLIQRVFSELHDEYEITAIINRFGDFVVFVWNWDLPNRCIWQGSNILEARAWIAKCREITEKE